MKRKTILMLLESNFVEDERVKKECIVLSDNGFEVHVLFPKFKNQVESKDRFEYPFVNMHSFEVEKFIFNKMLASCLALPFYFYFWKKKAISLIPTIKNFSCVYIHDLPLSKVGLIIKNKYNVKLICDQHEFYSDWIVRTKHMKSFAGKIILLFSNWKKYECEMLLKSDLNITVTDKLLEKYLSATSINKEKIVTLPNTPMKEYYKNPELIDPNIEKLFKSNKSTRAIYVGANFSFERGLNLMIDAIPEIVKSFPNFKFMLLGKIHSSYDIKSHIEKNKVEQYVEIIGMVPNNLIPSYLACSSIGVNLHVPNSLEAHNSISTKIYQYIASNLLIVSSECKLMAELVRENKIGSVFEYTSKDLAKTIIQILESDSFLKECIANTQNVKNVFWENTSQEWIEKVKKVLN